MQPYSLWRGPWLAWFSKPFYQHLGRHGRGIGFVYLLGLCALCTLPSYWFVQGAITHFYDQQLDGYLGQVPTLHFRDGSLSIEQQEPVEIREGDQPLVVIDTSGHYQSLDEIDAPVLVTKHELIMRKGPGRTEHMEFSQLPDMVVDQPMMRRLFDEVRRIAGKFIYPLIWLSDWGYRTFQALMLGGFALLLARRRNLPMTYATGIRLAALALTPAVMLQALLVLLNLSLPAAWLLFLALELGYVYFAVAQQQGDDDALSGTLVV
ncbi:DUF1189 family protein [Pseudaeromonas sp. ZJS20]|uniref:DUF1189 family protein n=1 Tax=Pseudaeromonas aegiceratis TaxID=3153928 RepID=UPI00390CC0B7